jgi:predicted nucleotidyltransferase
MVPGDRRSGVPSAGDYSRRKSSPERKSTAKINTMKRDEVIAALRAHEPELKAAGVASLSLFGSVARGDENEGSDVDVVVRLTEEASQGGFAYFGRLDALRDRLSAIVGHPVDVITEPVRRDQLRRAIETESALAF